MKWASKASYIYLKSKVSIFGAKHIFEKLSLQGKAIFGAKIHFFEKLAVIFDEFWCENSNNW